MAQKFYLNTNIIFTFLASFITMIFMHGCDSKKIINLGTISSYKPYLTNDTLKSAELAHICYKEILFFKDKNNKDLTIENLLKQAQKELNKSNFENVSIYLKSINFGHIYTKVCMYLGKIESEIKQNSQDSKNDKYMQDVEHDSQNMSKTQQNTIKMQNEKRRKDSQ